MNATVYLAFGHHNDGELHDPEYDVSGVFTTQEAAVAFAQRHYPRTGWVERWHVDQPDLSPEDVWAARKQNPQAA